MKPRVLVVGSGGVGTVVAMGLASNGLSEVSLIVRSGFEEISTKGFTIDSSAYGQIDGWKPTHVYKSVGDALAGEHGFDYIIVTTKNIPDGNNKCEDILKPFTEQIEKSGLTILLVQNGIGIETPMIEAFPNNLTLSAVSHVGSSRYGNKIIQKRLDQLFVGDFDNPLAKKFPDTNDKISTLIKLLTAPNGQNTVVHDTNVRKTRWEKLVYNSVWNPISALVDMDTTTISIATGNEALIRPAMLEVVNIAKSDGVELDLAIVEKFIHIGDGLFYKPSMCVDIHKNQLLEVEIMLGNPLRIAEKNGVAAPILGVIYQLCKMKQFHLKQIGGLVKINEDDFRGNSDDYDKILSEKY